MCEPPPFISTIPIFADLNPSINVAYPRGFDQSPESDKLGIQLAVPAIPDLQRLEICKQKSSTEEEFFECVTAEALPKGYRIAQKCLEQEADLASAAVCSTNNEDVKEAYEKFIEVKDCTEQEGQDEFEVAQCIGDSVLGENERYYLRCVTENRGEVSTAAICAVARDLNPEQQIALSCAVSTGGVPKAFAICTAGRLTARELDKCWQGGIGTDTGCFGPNNELRKASRLVRDKVCEVTGQNSAVCHAYSFWNNNVLMPGPNHEAVKIFNNALNDFKNGPGENHEIVKAGKQVEEFFQSVGGALGF